MRAWIAALVVLLLCSLPARAATQSEAVGAYRAGDYARASELWKAELGQAESERERARLAYDLGNASYRQGRVLEAVAWYTKSLRHHPRGRDVWHNLELARAEAGLDPADRGDLEATIVRLLSSLSLAEAEWLLLGLIGLLGLCLAGEAVLGRVFRMPAWVALGAVLLGSLPWLWALRQAGGHPWMVVEARGVPARSEPRATAKILTELPAGTILAQTDGLPDWVEVRVPGKGELWVRQSSLFDLDR